MPTIGINTDKSSVDTFEKLVDHMKADPYFKSILPGFKDYISNSRYLMSKNEKMKKVSQMAINYIEFDAEQLMREAIRKALKDLVVSEAVDNA